MYKSFTLFVEEDPIVPAFAKPSAWANSSSADSAMPPRNLEKKL
jgi:hypothetical protein